jgi:hypothetical protein
MLIKSRIVLLLRSNIGYNLYMHTHGMRIAVAFESGKHPVKIKVITIKWKIIRTFATWK